MNINFKYGYEPELWSEGGFVEGGRTSYIRIEGMWEAAVSLSACISCGKEMSKTILGNWVCMSCGTMHA